MSQPVNNRHLINNCSIEHTSVAKKTSSFKSGLGNTDLSRTGLKALKLPNSEKEENQNKKEMDEEGKEEILIVKNETENVQDTKKEENNIQQEGIRKEETVSRSKGKGGKLNTDKKENENQEGKLKWNISVKGKIKKIEDLMKKEEIKGRRNTETKKGRRKQSEKGILAGEQSIRKFLIQERKSSTSKRKFLEGSEEGENMLEGSHKKRRKIETGRNMAIRDATH